MSDVIMTGKSPTLMWTCRTCGTHVTAEVWSCQSCGYKRTEFDLARSVSPGDTGSFIATRLTQPSFSELSNRTGNVGRKAIVAFAAGSVLAILAILALAYLRSC